MVEVHTLEPEPGELASRADEAFRLGGDQHAGMHVLLPAYVSRLVEMLGQLEVPADRRGEQVRAPLLEGDLERPALVAVVGQVDLQVERLAVAAARAERLDHALEPVRRRLTVISASAQPPTQRAVSLVTAAPISAAAARAWSTSAPGRP